MLAKLIVKERNRKLCIKKMIHALNTFILRGFNNNIKFLISIFNSKNFINGDIHTGLLDLVYKDGYNTPSANKDLIKNIILPTASYVGYTILKKTNTNFKENKKERTFCLTLNKKTFNLRIKFNNTFRVFYKKKIYNVKSSWIPYENLIKIKINKNEYLIQFDLEKDFFSLTYLDYVFNCTFLDKFTAKFNNYMLEEDEQDLSQFLLAPMPGKIVSINVKEGQKIKSGENILVLEAMKMENMITSVKAATIKKINIKKGEAVEVDQILIEFNKSFLSINIELWSDAHAPILLS